MLFQAHLPKLLVKMQEHQRAEAGLIASWMLSRWDSPNTPAHPLASLLLILEWIKKGLKNAGDGIFREIFEKNLDFAIQRSIKACRGSLAVIGMVLVLGVIGAGCTTQDSPPRPIQPSRLRLVVLNDARLAEAFRQYEGQWQAETGNLLEVRAELADSLESQPSFSKEADVVVFASGMLGELAEAKHLTPLSQEKLAPYESAWTNLLERIRDQEGRWGQEVWAVPFGSPVLVCYCRADLFERLHLQPPRSWEEYVRVAEILHERTKLGSGAPPADRPWSGVAEPLGPGWAASVLLARAASYAKHPDYYSCLFDMETMAPRIDQAPFVRALEDLAAAAKFSSSDALQDDPDRVRERFWRGECGMALTWPTRAGPEKSAPGVQCTIVPLPGASAVYHPKEHQWLPAPKGEVFRVPILGIAGRWAGVASQSDQPETALQLIFWLVSKQGMEPRPTVCPAITLCRRSDLKNPQQLRNWVEPAMSSQTALQYAETLQQSLSTPQWLVSLRIPGRAEYLAALEAAVHATLRGQKTPSEALQEAAQTWRTTTSRYGVEKQRAAYRRNLGLE